MKMTNLERLQTANIEEMANFIYEITENGFSSNSKFLKFFTEFCERDCPERQICNSEENYCCKEDKTEFIKYWLNRKGDDFI